MPNVLKLYLENGQTKAFKFEANTTVKVLTVNLTIFPSENLLAPRAPRHLALQLPCQSHSHPGLKPCNKPSTVLPHLAAQPPSEIGFFPSHHLAEVEIRVQRGVVPKVILQLVSLHP